MTVGVDRRSLTAAGAARAIGCGRFQVIQYIETKQLRAYRLPGTRRDRRILVRDLVAFMRANGIPVGALAGLTTVLVATSARLWPARLAHALPDTCEVQVAGTLFELARLAERLTPAAVVCDLALGRGEILHAARDLRRDHPRLLLAALLGEDETRPGDATAAGFDLVYRQPAAHEAVAAGVMARLGETALC